MGLTPTKNAIIGTFINGRNDQNDFLQLATNNGDSVFAWIDAQGIPRGALAPTATPGGSNTSIQFNDAGVFGGSTNFTYDKIAQLVTLGVGNVVLGSGNLTLTSGNETLTSGNLTLSAGLLSVHAGSASQVVPATIITSGNGPTNVTTAALLLTDGVTPGVGTYFLSQGNNFRIRNDSTLQAQHGDFNFGSFGVYLNGGISSPTLFLFNGAAIGPPPNVPSQSAQIDLLGSGLLAVTTNPGAGDFGQILIASKTNTITFTGNVTGSASIGTSTTCGTPNKINLPLTTGTSGQFLQTDGGNPQQTSWVTPTLQKAVVTLSSAQLKALPTPVTVVPAQGANTAIVVQNHVLQYKFGTTPYTIANSDNAFALAYAGTPGNTMDTGQNATGFVDQSVNEFTYQAWTDTDSATLPQTSVSNTAVQIILTGTTPALTVGDGTVVVTVYYYTVPLL